MRCYVRSFGGSCFYPRNTHIDYLFFCIDYFLLQFAQAGSGHRLFLNVHRLFIFAHRLFPFCSLPNQGRDIDYFKSGMYRLELI